MTEHFGYLWQDGTWHHDPEGQTVLVEVEDGWINENCPEECSTPHPAPPTSVDDENFPEDGLWICPENGYRYGAYSTSHASIEWEPISRWDVPFEVDGYWFPGVERAYNDGLSQCDNCGVWGEDHDWSERHEASFCYRCHPGDDDDDDPERCHREAEAPRCQCGSFNGLTFLKVSETWACSQHNKENEK